MRRRMEKNKCVQDTYPLLSIKSSLIGLRTNDGVACTQCNIVAKQVLNLILILDILCPTKIQFSNLGYKNPTSWYYLFIYLFIYLSIL